MCTPENGLWDLQFLGLKVQTQFIRFFQPYSFVWCSPVDPAGPVLDTTLMVKVKDNRCSFLHHWLTCLKGECGNGHIIWMVITKNILLYISIQYLPLGFGISSCGIFTQDSNGVSVALLPIEFTIICARVHGTSNCNLEGFVQSDLVLVFVPFHSIPTIAAFTFQIK